MQFARNVVTAGALASPICFYLGLQPNTNTKTRTGPTVDASCRRLNLPTPSQAQHVQVINVPALLSEAQVSIILKETAIARQQRKIGWVERTGKTGRQKSGGDWRTSYIHSDGFASNLFNTDELLDTLLTAVENEAKKESGWSMMNRFLKMRDRKKLNFRTIEVHEYLPGGGLPERKHYDAGSLITVDVILADGFEGGKLYCPVYGEDENVVVRREVVEGGGFSNVGDAVIFPSHKFHNVSQVTSGKRIVLVMEIWEGEAKKCFHRCLKDNNGETCEYNKEQFDLLLMMNTISML